LRRRLSPDLLFFEELPKMQKSDYCCNKPRPLLTFTKYESFYFGKWLTERIHIQVN